ncbi:MAG: lysophospholipid acyltransferase family protein, partial [Planctomycetes bacterium]|nr:lysophospholipid acyltransferase family protein [Planctomycetota bacterium]
LLEYFSVMLGYALLAYPPLPVSKAVVFFLAAVWRLLTRRHRIRIMTQSMDRLGLGEAEAKRLVKANYRHYLLVFMEVARLNRMSDDEAALRTDINGSDRIMADILAKGKGMVLITGHLGNWEWGAVMLGRLKAVDGFIARPLDNPRLDLFVNRIRERTGAAVWSKKGAIRKALAALRNARGLVAVADQDGDRHGIPAPFLGKPGTTMPAPVDLAIRVGAPLFVGAVMRAEGDLKFVMVPKRVHWPRPDADPAEERVRLATAMNEDLSEIIREYPEQWIWIHNRWKSVEVEF